MEASPNGGALAWKASFRKDMRVRFPPLPPKISQGSPEGILGISQ